MGTRDTDRLSRSRGLALLLALFYGVLTGGGLTPAPAQAQSHITTLSPAGHSALVATAKGKATLKAQRATPDPLLLPNNTAEVRTLLLRAGGEPFAARSLPAAKRFSSPYRARAPPAS